MKWLLLIMSVELVADCVALPHPPNWKNPVQVTRRWNTEIARAVTGAEDRSTGQSKPFYTQEWNVLSWTVSENERLTARLLDALKRGRAIAPFFARAQYIGINQPQPWETWGGAPNTYRVTGLQQGDVYLYTKGQYDTRLYTGNTQLTASGTFIADASYCFIEMSNLVVPGTVVSQSPNRAIGSVVGNTQAQTDGEWEWEEGKYVFFMRDRAEVPSYENRYLIVDVGNGLDSEWISGGYAATTEASIDTSLVEGYDALADGVYRTARIIDDRSALTPTWSSFLQGWLFQGLTVGQQYFYRKGTNDAGLISLTANGNPNNLMASGVFTAKVDWAYISCPQDKTPGTFRPKEEIVATFQDLMPNVECNLRLHFAELDINRRIFDVTVEGTKTYVVNRVDPYFEASAMEVATTLDMQVTPDYTGKLVVRITPSAYGNSLMAGLNAIELRQYTWEVKQLTAGTGPNLIAWEGYLNGCYRVGAPVYPAIFGRPSVRGSQALTDRVGELALSIAEPLGDGGQGLSGQCAAEECQSDPNIPIVGPDEDLILTDVSEGMLTWEPLYYENEFATGYPVGKNPSTPDEDGLLDGTLDAWKAWVWERWEMYKFQNGIIPSTEQLLWKQTVAGSSSRYNADFLFYYDPPVTNRAFGWNLELWIAYTTPPA